MIKSNYSHNHAINPSVNTEMKKSELYNIDNTKNRLAERIYDFVKGWSDTLPGYSFIDKITQITDSKVISQGKGVEVHLEISEDKSCYVLCIDVETRINDHKSRVDKVTPYEHTKNIDIRGTITNIDNLAINDKRRNNIPEIDERRFQVLKHYVSGYEVKKEIEEKTTIK